jgi:hypothetical protein
MKAAGTSQNSPAQRLVEFFKKTEDSDLILACENKKTKEIILYSKKPDVLHSLRKYFSDDYANKVKAQQNLARDTIIKFVDQGRYGDDLSNQSSKEIKSILAGKAGDIKVGHLKTLFEKLNTHQPIRKAHERQANDAWYVCSRQLAQSSEVKNYSQIPLILQAVGNMSANDTEKLKSMLASAQSLSSMDKEELGRQIDALKKFMKQKGARELDQIDYQRIHRLALAWKYVDSSLKNIDQTFSEKNPLAAACLFLSNFEKSTAENIDINVVSGSLGLHLSDVIVVAGQLRDDDASDLASSREKEIILTLPKAQKNISNSDIVALQVQKNTSTASSTLIKLPSPQADKGTFPMQQLRRSYRQISELISHWQKRSQEDPGIHRRSPTRSLLISPISVDGSESADKVLRVFAEELLNMLEAMPTLKITVRETPDFSRIAIQDALNDATFRRKKAGQTIHI